MTGHAASLDDQRFFAQTGRRWICFTAFIIAVATHSAVLFGFSPERSRACPDIQEERGVEIDLSASLAAAGSATTARPHESVQDTRDTGAPPDTALAVPETPLETTRKKKVIRKSSPAKAAAPISDGVGANEGGQAGFRSGAPAGTGEESGGREKPLADVKNPKPAYPRLARQRGQEGETLLRVSVDAAGVVTAVSVLRGSGFPMLDEAAIKGVSRWRFKPAMRNGAAVAGQVMVPVVFRLR